jgi:hypothetical protein
MTDHDLHSENPEASYPPEHFRIAFDLYRCIAFYNAALSDKADHTAMVDEAIENAYQALLQVAYILPVPQERYIESLQEIFESLQGKKEDFRAVFLALRRTCGKVIGRLGVPKEELKAELRAYPAQQEQARKMYLKIVFDFLYTKKILQASKFDSSHKARIHKLVEKYGEQKMKNRKVYNDYIEFRDTNKLRITSPTVALGALDELLLLSDAPTRVTDPLFKEIQAYKDRIEKEVSTVQNQEDVDVESFDVDAYLKQRFTKSYEQGHVRPDMDPAIIEEIDSLSLKILTMLFPELISQTAEQQKQRIMTYIEVDGELPRPALTVPHMYAEDGDA